MFTRRLVGGHHRTVGSSSLSARAEYHLLFLSRVPVLLYSFLPWPCPFLPLVARTPTTKQTGLLHTYMFSPVRFQGKKEFAHVPFLQICHRRIYVSARTGKESATCLKSLLYLDTYLSSDYHLELPLMVLS